MPKDTKISNDRFFILLSSKKAYCRSLLKRSTLFPDFGRHYHRTMVDSQSLRSSHWFNRFGSLRQLLWSQVPYCGLQSEVLWSVSFLSNSWLLVVSDLLHVFIRRCCGLVWRGIRVMSHDRRWCRRDSRREHGAHHFLSLSVDSAGRRLENKEISCCDIVCEWVYIVSHRVWFCARREDLRL